jgi:high-affinity iron transporter
LRAERSFLDGEENQPGIKALFDQRTKGPALEDAFARTLAAVDQCTALLKVNLSPATVIYTVLAISAREGLEAVVVLAALLAGMRGAEHRYTRKRIVTGAWLALAATALTFWISRTVIQSLSRYGEKLEAVISILAVLVLLMVTNWVAAKFTGLVEREIAEVEQIWRDWHRVPPRMVVAGAVGFLRFTVKV